MARDVAAGGAERSLREEALAKPWGTIIAFLLPALIIYVAFTAYPALRTLWNSFHKVLPHLDW